MGKGPRYRVVLKRRRENKTDYRKRKIMILSKIPRLVVRGSLKNMQAQIIEALPNGDRTLIAVNSKDLRGYGWKAPCGNVPASYLTGLLLGYKAQILGIDKIIPDIGLRRSSLGSRVYATVNGVMDSELFIKCGDVLPEESRIRGKHIASYASELAKAEPELYKRRFSGYLSSDLKPEQLPNHFDEVKSKIIQTFNKEE